MPGKHSDETNGRSVQGRNDVESLKVFHVYESLIFLAINNAAVPGDHSLLDLKEGNDFVVN